MKNIFVVLLLCFSCVCGATDRTDNFNRTDTTNNIGTPSDGGSAWSQISGTWGITTNRAYASASPGQDICVLETSESTGYVQVTFTTVSSSAGVVARMTDNSNYLLVSIVPGTITMHKRVAGSFTTLGSYASGASGDTVKFTYNSSNNLEAFLNGVSRISVTDSAGSANTKVGIRVATDTLSRFDDFSFIGSSGATVVPTRSLMGVGP